MANTDLFAVNINGVCKTAAAGSATPAAAIALTTADDTITFYLGLDAVAKGVRTPGGQDLPIQRTIILMGDAAWALSDVAGMAYANKFGPFAAGQPITIGLTKGTTVLYVMAAVTANLRHWVQA